jgi:hypothetical protein
MAAVTEAPARTPLAYGSDNSSGGVAIAAEQAPDNFHVLSVAQLIFDRTISVRELVRAR